MLAIYPALDTPGLNDVLGSFYVSPKCSSPSPYPHSLAISLQDCIT
jgi:hypothetical protein